MEENFVSLSEIKKLLSVSTATVYRWMEHEGLPRPIRFSPQTVRWKQSEINAWIMQKQASSGATRGAAH
ncbi:helix-turn-helix transcriptional regulator [Xanthobacter sp. TB0139]|uniref:helix-turn-helix transcriptional regulator n=1 Tax=Xanthobacter sp. TB0139 TaxID=3459178 RepID=UPI00403A3D28